MNENDDTNTTEAPTRRDYMKYGGAVVGGTLLAGCAGQSDTESTPGEESKTPETEPTGTTEQETETEQESWTVTLKPSGTMTFTEVPETFTVYSPAMAEIMTVLGHADSLAAVQGLNVSFPSRHFPKIPDVNIDTSDILDFAGEGVDKEIFYEANPDINLIDPGIAIEYLGMTEKDVDEVSDNVAPFFGSDMRRQQLSEQHPYYELYEGMEKFARVFQEMERYEAIKSLHDEFVSTVEIPPVSEREWETYFVGHGNWWEDFSQFYPARVTEPGYNMQPFKDLGFKDENNAFDGMMDWDNYAPVDKEAILEADPDIVLWYGGARMSQEGGWNAFGTTGKWEEDVHEPFKQDPVLSEVTAAQEDRIIPIGNYGGGPIQSLFNTEEIAKGLNPEKFGEFTFGETPEDEWVFDRRRLADIINGNL